MNPPGDFSDDYLVTCPRCACEFHPVPRVTAFFAKCPDCAEPVRVPAAAEIEAEREEAEGDTYRISLPADWEQPEPTPTNTPPVQASIEEDRPSPFSDADDDDAMERDVSTIACPACGASFEPPFSEQTQTILCPECLEDVVVPPASERRPAKPKKKKKSSAEIFEAEDIAPATPPPKRKRKKPRSQLGENPSEDKNPTRREKPKNVHDVMAEIRREEEDPPPEWTFLSGVTDFLIRPEVVMKWVFASVGVCFVGWLCFVCVHFYQTFPMALAFFCLPLIWLLLMTFSYTASHAMPILAETAAGKDVIEGWPEPIMKEQAVDLVYWAFMGIVTETMSFVLAQFVSVVIGPAWLIALIFGFLLYPIILLSSLEANTPFVPFTLPILRSLQTVTWAWGVFYLLTGGLLSLWVIPIVGLLSASGMTQFLAMIFVAPLIAGFCFLYARLLGRLAWRASLEFPDEEDSEPEPEQKPRKKGKKRKKKRKTPATESSGELRTAQF